MSFSTKAIQTTLQPILTPVHSSFPFPLIDVYVAMRLSLIADWMARGVFDPPSLVVGVKEKHKSKDRNGKRRAGVLQEVVGIMVVVFGGETFLALCTGSTPSWLVNPNYALLFGLAHVIQTRTPLRAFLPSRPSLALELGLAIPDAISRTLLLTKFSILPLLHPTSPHALPATPSSLILVPFILAVPFASLIFSTTSFFAPSPTFTTPLELRPEGWQYVDSWAPIVIPVLFLALIGPVQGWPWGLKMEEGESVVVCMIILSAIFLLRALYNFGEDIWGTKKRKVE
nr:hypothetical protein L204_04902 [Cryptococcus depauperatus CBS 7855]